MARKLKLAQGLASLGVLCDHLPNGVKDATLVAYVVHLDLNLW